MIHIDTHILIWLLVGGTTLDESTVELLSEAFTRSELVVSVIVFAELAQLHLRGRIDLGMTPELWTRERQRDGLRVMPVTSEIAVRAAMLETTGFHGDPMDRLITATAMVDNHTLVTADSKIVEWANRTDS